MSKIQNMFHSASSTSAQGPIFPFNLLFIEITKTTRSQDIRIFRKINIGLGSNVQKT